MKIYIFTAVSDDDEITQKVYRTFDEAYEGGYLAHLGMWINDIVFEDNEIFDSTIFEKPYLATDHKTGLYASYGGSISPTELYIKEFEIE